MKLFIVTYHFKDVDGCDCESCEIVKVGGHVLEQHEWGLKILVNEQLTNVVKELAMLKYSPLRDFKIVSIEEA